MTLSQSKYKPVLKSKSYLVGSESILQHNEMQQEI